MDATLTFEFRIHEQLLPSIRRLGGEVEWTDVFVVHSGSDPSPAGRAKKYERDLRILEQELADRPDHPFALFNFGMTYSDMGEHGRAAEYLERSLRHSRPEETQVRKAYALLVHSHDQLGDTHRAAEICRQARELFPDDPELLFRHGKLAHDLGNLDESITAYRQLLEEEAERHFSSIDQGIRGYKARHNLALVHQDLQQPELAELEWRLALQTDLHFWPAWRALGEQLIRQKRLNTADALIARLREFPELELQAGLLAAERDRAGGEVEQARRQLEELQERHREAIEPLEALCRLEFEQGTPSAAILALQRLTARRPEDAAAWHNLGAALLREGDLAQAHDALSRSLAVRPEAPGTLELLKQALVAVRSAKVANPLSIRCTIPRQAVQNCSSPTPFSPALAAPNAAAESSAKRSRQLHVAVVTVAYNVPGATRTMINSARRDCRHELDFLVITHSRLPEKTRELEQIADDPDVELFDYGVNRGLAKSWNEGILWGYDRGADVVLVVNEDVQFEAGDVTRLAGAAHRQRDKFLVMGRCFHEDQQRWERSEYGCFAYNPPAFQLLGCFDENFFPIYLEDSDFRRRATLAGLEPGYCEDVAIHHIGSASLRQAEVARQNELTYAANQAYYHRKWGGQGGAEQFNRPFDDPRFSYFIDPRVRKTPYPGFDRDDHHLVTI